MRYLNGMDVTKAKVLFFDGEGDFGQGLWQVRSFDDKLLLATNFVSYYSKIKKLKIIYLL